MPGAPFVASDRSWSQTSLAYRHRSLTLEALKIGRSWLHRQRRGAAARCAEHHSALRFEDRIGLIEETGNILCIIDLVRIWQDPN